MDPLRITRGGKGEPVHRDPADYRRHTPAKESSSKKRSHSASPPTARKNKERSLGNKKKGESKDIAQKAASRKRTAASITPKQAKAQKEKEEEAEQKRKAEEELEARLRVQRGEDGGGPHHQAGR